jgi:hypothetical protein
MGGERALIGGDAIRVLSVDNDLMVDGVFGEMLRAFGSPKIAPSESLRVGIGDMSTIVLGDFGGT